ncbi:MAG: hypothetical protein ACOYJB_00065 [Christensenellaceae bacterium]|jgi:hypothetical protein
MAIDISGASNLLTSGILSGQSQTNTNAAGTNNAFSTLLNTYMASSLGSALDFSGTGGTSSYMDSMTGLTGMGSLFGTGDSSSSSSLTMMLLLLLLADGSGKNNNSSLLNALTGNTSSAQTANTTGHQHVYGANAYTMNNTVPAAELSVTNVSGERAADSYRAVIDQFNVELNRRYNPGGTSVVPENVFVWDVTRAMGAEIPYYINSSTGAPAAVGAGTAANANAENDWLNTYGAAYGWTKVSAEDAQRYANSGMPAVASYKSAAGDGHMMVVSPSENGVYSSANGVALAQAGSTPSNYTYINSLYGPAITEQTEYFVHI